MYFYICAHINMHLYTNTGQQNTEKLTASISQENSFKVYFKEGNLRDLPVL